MKKNMPRSRKKYFFAAIASICIAGLGQSLKGEGKKGLKIMLWFYFGLPTMILLSMIANSYIFLITSSLVIIIYPIIWTYNVIDAFAHQPR